MLRDPGGGRGAGPRGEPGGSALCGVRARRPGV